MDTATRSLKQTIDRIKAVAFDLSGVLVDTEDHHFEAHRHALREAGIDLSREQYITHGISRDPLEFYREVLGLDTYESSRLQDLHSLKQHFYASRLAERRLIAIPPAIDLVRALHKKETTLALVTAETRQAAESALDELSIRKCFSVLVSGTDSNLPNKPHPALYVSAASELGITPEDGLAIEDSANGARSAVGACFTCVVVPNSYTIQQNFPKEAVLLSWEDLHRVLITGGEL